MVTARGTALGTTTGAGVNSIERGWIKRTGDVIVIVTVVDVIAALLETGIEIEIDAATEIETVVKVDIVTRTETDTAAVAIAQRAGSLVVTVAIVIAAARGAAGRVEMVAVVMRTCLRRALPRPGKRLPQPEEEEEEAVTGTVTAIKHLSVKAATPSISLLVHIRARRSLPHQSCATRVIVH